MITDHVGEPEAVRLVGLWRTGLNHHAPEGDSDGPDSGLSHTMLAVFVAPIELTGHPMELAVAVPCSSRVQRFAICSQYGQVVWGILVVQVGVEGCKSAKSIGL